MFVPVELPTFDLVAMLFAAVALLGLAYRRGRAILRRRPSSNLPVKRSDGTLTCTSCSASFEYLIVHNGFNDSAYAYCDTCGMITLLSGWATNIPANVPLRVHQRIAPEIEEHLQPCACGGTFRADAAPRCPACRHPIDAVQAAREIERNAPGTKSGWRWQQNWSGLYAIIVDGRWTNDNWR